jgi:GrpB-like predicted nucleotidyltransferase (UPF0157 family)
MITITRPICITTIAMDDVTILPYVRRVPPVCEEWDPRSAVAAARLIAAIRARLPDVSVEHVGSTSVPCAGKGYVDLLLAYPDGAFDEVTTELDALGFQRQQGRDPFREDRAMRVGAIEEGGALIPIHAHVVAARSPEAEDMRTFRDRLRADPALRDAYVAKKRAILRAGVRDSIIYAIEKGDFVVDVLDPTD